MRNIEAVAFTNNKMNWVDFEVNQTTCERNVTREYVWLNGDSNSGTYELTIDPQSYTYTSSDGKIAIVNDGTDDIRNVKVNEELNATQLMNETGLFLPLTAHGYRVTYMNIATGSGATAVRLDDNTISYLESYYLNNHILDTLCGVPAP